MKKQILDIIEKDQKEEFLCNIFHGIQDSILIMNVKGDILSYNMRILSILALESMEGIKNLRQITPDDVNFSVAEKYLAEAIECEEQFFTWQLIRPLEKTVIDVEIYMTCVDKMGEKVLLATIRDITDKKLIEDSLRNSEKRYRQLVELSPEGIVIHRNGIVKFVNPAAARILGGEKAEDILGREVMSFFPVQRRDIIRERMKKLYEEKIALPLMESEMIRVDNKKIDVEFASMPFDLDGNVAVQVVIRDITVKKQQDKYIRYLALHDTLTSLPNRDLLSDRIAKALERRKRDKLKNAVMYIDLDGFKPVNDTLGHDAGDEALKKIARRLEDAIRGSDTAARIGGDEFVVLLEGVEDREKIEIIAGRVLDGINEPLEIMGHTFHVGASIGVSVYPDDSADSAQLLSKADKAMYHVKDTGKNRVLFYSDIKI